MNIRVIRTPAFVWRLRDGDFFLVESNTAAAPLVPHELLRPGMAAASIPSIVQTEALFRAQTEGGLWSPPAAFSSDPVTEPCPGLRPSFLALDETDVLQVFAAPPKSSDTVFKTMIDRGSDVISIHDLNHRVLYQSPSIEPILGYTPEELVGEPVEGYLHPDDLSVVETQFQTVYRFAGQHPAFEVRFRHRDGSWLWFECKGTHFFDQDGLPLVVFNARDISERKALQVKVAHSQRLEALGRLACGVAHDFNNYLMILKGNLDLLSLPNAEDSAAALTDMALALQNCALLTRQLQMFGSKHTYKLAEIDLNGVLAESLALVKRLLDLEVQVVEDWGVLPKIWADPSQMTQILVNLATNARDAMPDGGALTVRTRLLSSQARATVSIQVCDTGTGVDPAIRDRILEPFFTTKAEGVGMGMGLSIVYGIVKQANGEIEIDSEPGKGTCVTIRLPVQKGQSRIS